MMANPPAAPVETLEFPVTLMASRPTPAAFRKIGVAKVAGLAIYTPTDQLRAVLLGTAGAWPRDPMDTRLMRSVADGSFATAPRNANPAGDALLPAYPGSPPAAPADTDNDGMPDTWETASGLNPYLHELSVTRTGGSVL